MEQTPIKISKVPRSNQQTANRRKESLDTAQKISSSVGTSAESRFHASIDCNKNVIDAAEVTKESQDRLGVQIKKASTPELIAKSIGESHDASIESPLSASPGMRSSQDDGRAITDYRNIHADRPTDNLRHNYMFLFYNPTSGGNTASVLADPALSPAVLYYGNECVHLNLYDIRDGLPKKKPGFLRLKEAIDQFSSERLFRVVVGGGDGTVMWCVSEMRSHEVDMKKVAVGVIPFGTGN